MEGESRQDEASTLLGRGKCLKPLLAKLAKGVVDTEPQPTFAKTSVARDQKSTQR